MKRKVIIEALPKAKTGMQVGYGLYNRLATMGGLSDSRPRNDFGVGKTVGGVPREEANLEAEGGETVVTDLVGMGIPQHYTISGPRHAQGGVPMDLPDNSFIFSDFHNMKVKDADVLNYFGKTVKKGGKGKGYTYADVAKQYDINKYLQILNDPNSDDIDKKTAERMIENFNLKLGALGLHQESVKGFEQGVPEVSIPYMEKMGITEEDLGIDPQQSMPQEMMAYGGVPPVPFYGDEPFNLDPSNEIPGGIPPGMRNKKDARKLKRVINQKIRQGYVNPEGVDYSDFAKTRTKDFIVNAPGVFYDGGCTTCNKAKRRQMGGAEEMMAPEQMMDQSSMEQQDPMAEIMPMIEQMMQQGLDPNAIAMELLNMQVPPEMIMEAFVQMGMPEGEAQMAIEAAMSNEQPQEMMDPNMQGQGMTPDMMPAMDPAMMQMGGQEPSLEDMVAQALQEGANPEEILQALVQNGVPQEEAQQVVANVSQQMQQSQPMMRRGGYLPKAQSGYTFPTTFDAFGEPISVTTESELKDVEKMQRYREGEGYGKQLQDIDKTIKIHSWYFDDEKKIADFKKAASKKGPQKAIKDFQEAYNNKLRKEAKKKGLSEEDTNKIIEEVGFSDTGVRQLDGKFGAYTSSRPYFNFEEKPADPDKPADPNKPLDPNKPAKPVERPDITDPNLQEFRDPIEADWTAPDIVNFRGAIQDRMGLKSYFPYAERFNPEFADPTFMDPSRELAAQAEQANILTQGLGQFVGPQAMSSRASGIFGQGAKAAADTLGRYNQNNVGIANQFAMQNTQGANQAQQYNQAKMQELYDKGVITQQQFDNSKRQANAAIRQGFGQGWKNASDIALMNATSEQYSIDPLTGRVVFTGVDKPIDKQKAAKDYEQILDSYITKGFDPKTAVAAAKEHMRHAQGQPTFAQKGGYVLGANVFPFMFY